MYCFLNNYWNDSNRKILIWSKNWGICLECDTEFVTFYVTFLSLFWTKWSLPESRKKNCHFFVTFSKIFENTWDERLSWENFGFYFEINFCLILKEFSEALFTKFAKYLLEHVHNVENNEKSSRSIFSSCETFFCYFFVTFLAEM